MAIPYQRLKVVEHVTKMVCASLYTSAKNSFKSVFRKPNDIASQGYIHHLVNQSEKHYSDGKGQHINGLERFWEYLKRKLVLKVVSNRKNYLST
jgi:hypothetical protein